MPHPVLGAMPTHRYGEMTADLLRGAELFYVASDMGELARAAGESLPPIGLDQFDPPAKCGFMFFEGGACSVSHGDPPLDYLVNGVAWAELQGRGLVIERFADRDAMLDALAASGVASTRDAEYSRSVMPRAAPMAGGSWIPYGATAADQESQRFLQLDRIVRSAWLLMQQPVASTSEAEYKRHDRRRLEREKVNPAAVRVITLRRAKTESGRTDSDREYHHQWIVRGHWRQQWYPTRGVHRPVWIAPHIKGPEGAPLLGGEKVHAWVR